MRTIPLDTLLSELITLVSAAEIRPLAGAQCIASGQALFLIGTKRHLIS